MTRLLLDAAAVDALARKLADELPAGVVILLEGPIGAGKTTFARSFAAARGCSIAATSPTYSIAQCYPGLRGECWHLDCYRLRDPEEAAALDWEHFSTADALLVEWPERAGAWTPTADCTISFEHEGDLTRWVEVRK